jgi:hypothetical protein
VLPGGVLIMTNSALTVDNGVPPLTLPNGSAVDFDGVVNINNSSLNTTNATYTTVGSLPSGFGPGTFTLVNSSFTNHHLTVGSYSDGTATFMNSTVISAATLVL